MAKKTIKTGLYLPIGNSTEIDETVKLLSTHFATLQPVFNER